MYQNSETPTLFECHQPTTSRKLKKEVFIKTFYILRSIRTTQFLSYRRPEILQIRSGACVKIQSDKYTTYVVLCAT